MSKSTKKELAAQEVIEHKFHSPRTSIKKPTRALIKLWQKYGMNAARLTDQFGWTLINLSLYDHMLCTMSILQRFKNKQTYYINRLKCTCGETEVVISQDSKRPVVTCKKPDCLKTMNICQLSSFKYDLTIACATRKDTFPNPSAPKTKLTLSKNVLNNIPTKTYVDDKIIFQVTKFPRFGNKAAMGTGKIELIALTKELYESKSGSHDVYDIVRNSGAAAATDMTLDATIAIEEKTIAKEAQPRFQRAKTNWQRTSGKTRSNTTVDKSQAPTTFLRELLQDGTIQTKTVVKALESHAESNAAPKYPTIRRGRRQQLERRRLTITPVLTAIMNNIERS